MIFLTFQNSQTTFNYGYFITTLILIVLVSCKQKQQIVTYDIRISKNNLAEAYLEINGKKKTIQHRKF